MTSAPVFPGYRVVGLLGEGGMGQVFLADDEVLGRKVAIKTILPAVSGTGEARARFLREARAMATVEHPRVVRVYSFGEAAGQAYFVMELVEGETLALRLQRPPRPSLDESLRIARETAEALSAAWARGIVHRDIKPGNIMLDKDGHVHVTDFGLASPVESAGDQSVTREGMFVGSPHYVAPEQARDESVDFRTDVYSLGIVLFEMIAGRRPFEGKTSAEVIARQLSEPLPLLRSVAPDTPERVARLVHAMAEKDPTLRPASYPRLIASLSGAAPIDTETRPTAPIPAAVGGGRRRSRRVVVGVLLLLFALVALVYTLRGRFAHAARPTGDLVMAVIPFYGADDESSKEGRTLATLVESELRRLVADEDGRSVGLIAGSEPARNLRGARGEGARLRADMILWGEALAFRGEVEIQPALTRVAAAVDQLPKLSPFVLEAQGDSPIELRRKAALRLAEAMALVAARSALAAGRAETTLRLLRECRAAPDTLDLRAAALDRLGRSAEAQAVRREAESLRN